MPKKWELKAGEKNLVSRVTGIIKELLDMKRGPKYFDSFDETFDFFQERVSIAPEHWKRNSDGEIKWKQAIRNTAKPKTKNRKPDALTQGELMVFAEGGGFALPKHVPTHRECVEFPERGGFKPKLVKAKKSKYVKVPKPRPEHEADPMPPAVRAERTAQRVRLLVKELDNDIRDLVTQQIINDIDDGKWFFESRIRVKRRGRTDEE